MESSGQKRRFPPPWRVDKSSKDCYCVRDANGVTLAAIYCRDDLHRMKWAGYNSHLTSDEARRIATAIARIPELLMLRPGFYSRKGGDKRWKPSHPYHVALRDSYVRGNWDRINALCAYNGIPFDPTGERIIRDGSWCVYEFSRQVDALMFWDRFEGRWLRHKDFFYPDRPDDMPVMRVPPNFEKLYKKNGR